MTTQINKLFDLLDDWRRLPDYQLERRADIFFALYLSEIIKGRFTTDIQYIIPEFPIKKDDTNQSFKMDYIAVSDAIVYFIELKTDNASRRSTQDEYLEKAKEKNISALIDGVLEIRKKTKAKKKYDHLLEKLEQIGWVKQNKEKWENTIKHKDYNIQIVYIQPNNDHSNKTIISFDDVKKYLIHKEDELVQRFIKSLEKWK
jgi:hypothetical protein